MSQSKAIRKLLHRRVIIGIDVPVNEILEQQFGIFEIAGLVVIALPIDFSHGLSEISFPPHKLLNIRGVQEILVLLDEFLRAEVAIFVK